MPRRCCKTLALLLALNASALSAQGLPDPAALLAGAQETATLIDQYREILRNPDPNVRLSAFVQLARVNDPVVRQVAYDEGFASSDALLRDMALRYSFFDRSGFVIEYLDGTTPPDRLELQAVDLITGEFKVAGYPGRVQGSEVQLSNARCQANLTLDDADLLVGEMICSKDRYQVQIDLRGS